jgi:hypothetical protein
LLYAPLPKVVIEEEVHPAIFARVNCFFFSPPHYLQTQLGPFFSHPEPCLHLSLERKIREEKEREWLRRVVGITIFIIIGRENLMLTPLSVCLQSLSKRGSSGNMTIQYRRIARLVGIRRCNGVIQRRLWKLCRYIRKWHIDYPNKKMQRASGYNVPLLLFLGEKD